MISKTGYDHIVLSDRGAAIIAGTTMKIVELVPDHAVYGWSPEELHCQHPHLSMGQIHAALAYYWDHKVELEQDIQRRLELVDELEETASSASLAERLKTRRSD